MKKLFFIVALLYSVISYSQEGSETLYGQVMKEENTWKKEKNLFKFDENLSQVSLVNIESGIKQEFSRISDFTESETDGGYIYYQAFYVDTYTNSRVLFQIFKDDEYGIRLVYLNGTSFQYADRL